MPSGRITTPRKEDDRVEILSGLLDGVTLGTPIAMVVRNKDQRPQDYSEMAVAFRPSHADATYQAKYGIQARSGGGRASARETIGRVAAGAIAKQLLARAGGTEVLAWVQRIHTIEAQIDPAELSRVIWQSAQMLAFRDCFLATAVIGFMLLPLALMVPRKADRTNFTDRFKPVLTLFR